MERRREVVLEFQNYIEQPPVSKAQLYSQSCSNDNNTISFWRDTWVKNFKENHKNFGPFKDKSLGKLFAKHKLSPAIIAGAGPSLKHNSQHLKDRQDIPLISCLHNFHHLEDIGSPANYYVTLDAGDVTVEEVYEGGGKDEDHYWSLTKDRVLLAYVGANPKLLKKWQGQIYFFQCPVPDDQYHHECNQVENLTVNVGTGGNVLGACLYIAKAFLGCNPIAFVGADFSFSYDKKFHAWDSKYDKDIGHVIRSIDVFGNKVYTWQSYFNFKCWFDWVANSIPGIYINCSEGGCFGAYAEGNIMNVKQMALDDFIKMTLMYEHMRNQSENPETGDRKLLF